MDSQRQLRREEETEKSLEKHKAWRRQKDAAVCVCVDELKTEATTGRPRWQLQLHLADACIAETGRKRKEEEDEEEQAIKQENHKEDEQHKQHNSQW